MAIIMLLSSVIMRYSRHYIIDQAKHDSSYNIITHDIILATYSENWVGNLELALQLASNIFFICSLLLILMCTPSMHMLAIDMVWIERE